MSLLPASSRLSLLVGLYDNAANVAYAINQHLAQCMKMNEILF